MKHFNRLYTLLAATTALMLTSCGALIATDSVGYTPGYYGTGLSTDWYPPLAGAPLVSPVYWGGQIYPGSLLPPMAPTRPGSAAVPPANRPGGNKGGYGKGGFNKGGYKNERKEYVPGSGRRPGLPESSAEIINPVHMRQRKGWKKDSEE